MYFSGKIKTEQYLTCRINKKKQKQSKHGSMKVAMIHVTTLTSKIQKSSRLILRYTFEWIFFIINITGYKKCP